MVIIWLAIFFFARVYRLAIFLSSGDPDDDWATIIQQGPCMRQAVQDFTPHETLDHETSHRIASLTMRYSANQQREWLYEIMREAGRPAGWASPPRQALVSLVNAHAAVTQIPASRRVCFYRACFLACLRRRVRVDAMACTPSVCDMLQGELQYKQAVHDYRSM
jgi:hypothetical protein